MKLMGLKEYENKRFTPESKPDRRTLISWIERGKLPGRKIGHAYFVDIEAEEKQGRKTGNKLADLILESTT